MSKILWMHPDKCTGCKLCEVACSFKKYDEINPSKSRISTVIYESPPFYVAMACPQCDDPWCANACPSAALEKNPEDGIVRVNEDRCVGCKMCVLACPFGAIEYAPEEKIAVKCDYCEGQPECVEFCPTAALEFKDADEGGTGQKKRSLADTLREAYMEGGSL